MAAPKKTASNTFFHRCCGNSRPSGKASTRAEKPNPLSRYASQRCRDIRLAGFLFFEKPLQVEAADGRGGGIKTPAHLNFLSYLLRQLGWNIESFRLAIDQYRNLKLGMKVLAVGAMTVGLSASSFAIDKGARQHFTERTETANEFAAEFQVGVGGLFHMTLILVSEIGKVKQYRRFAKMPLTGIRSERPWKPAAWRRISPYFTESLPFWSKLSYPPSPGICSA